MRQKLLLVWTLRKRFDKVNVGSLQNQMGELIVVCAVKMRRYFKKIQILYIGESMAVENNVENGGIIDI